MVKPIILCNSETCPFKKSCYRGSFIPRMGSHSHANLEEYEEDNFGKCANFLCNNVYSKLYQKGDDR